MVDLTGDSKTDAINRAIQVYNGADYARKGPRLARVSTLTNPPPAGAAVGLASSGDTCPEMQRCTFAGLADS